MCLCVRVLVCMCVFVFVLDQVLPSLLRLYTKKTEICSLYRFAAGEKSCTRSHLLGSTIKLLDSQNVPANVLRTQLKCGLFNYIVLVGCLIVTKFCSTNKQYVKIKLMQNETILWSIFC